MAGRTGFLNLASSFEWMTEDAALLTLAVAVVLEVVAYYVPLLNNLLDAIAMPAAVAAGVLVSAANIETASPLLNWSLAAVTGGGAAAVVRSGTTLLRGAVTAFTGGLATPVVSTGENGAAVGFSLLAIIAPLVALAATLVLVAVVVPLAWRAFKRRRVGIAQTPSAAS